MSLPSRSLALGLLLLVGFVGVTLAVQWWLVRETGRLRRQMITETTATLDHVLALAPADAARWDDALLARLAGIVGGRVELVPGDAAASVAVAGVPFRIERPAPGRPGWLVRATIDSRSLERIQLLHHRALVAIAVLAALLLLVAWWLALLGVRTAPDGSTTTRGPWETIRAHASGMEHFARVSVERGEALEKEQGARQRAEEDLQVNRSLLDRSLGERVRLGRELHDNICQTLYAVSLTLEAAARKLEPGSEAARRLDQCGQELRRLNREVRDFLRELEPGEVNRQSLSAAIGAMIASLPVEAGVALEPRLDQEAIALAPPQHAAEIVSILREAVSNSLRHSRARRIVVRAERGADEVAFAVIDDGQGFSPPAAGRAGGGHGLANMEARTRAIGGTWRLHSSPGNGTRLTFTVPVRSEA